MAELDHDDRADMDGLVHAIIHVSADMRTQAHTHTHTHTHTQGQGQGCSSMRTHTKMRTHTLTKHANADMRTQAHTHTGEGVREHAHTNKVAHTYSHKLC
jgi:hypothetical protein